MAAFATDDRARAGEPAPGARVHLISIRSARSRCQFKVAGLYRVQPVVAPLDSLHSRDKEEFSTVNSLLPVGKTGLWDRDERARCESIG
ncbi:unnamed protein product [Arctia plantaginis]|uniref:Uncharacterized protein n=1 Tax=Arctia plantaginis TaxID=874455 RepID=A0A8S1AL91_ARCPL|nr:unnamed protein product [Arctia plantaginis]